MAQLVTFLSDFGNQDSYVAEVKGRLLSQNPHLQILDISHQVPPGEIEWGAFLLLQAYRCFPPKTLHLAVVDPLTPLGVDYLWVETKHHAFVGPQNGLLRWALEHAQAQEGHPPRGVILPAGPHAAPGHFVIRDEIAPLVPTFFETDAQKKFPACTDWGGRAFPRPQIENPVMRGEILGLDRFGNAITNLNILEKTPRTLEVVELGQTFEFVDSFHSLGENASGVVPGAWGFYEIVCHRASAHAQWGLEKGMSWVAKN